MQPGKHSPLPQINPGGHESGLERHFLIGGAAVGIGGGRVSISGVEVRMVVEGFIVGGLIVVVIVVDSCSQYLKRQLEWYINVKDLLHKYMVV